MKGRPRIAVVSPFLDKRHGTERVVAEQVERLAHQYGWEVHIFSQRVEDLIGVERPRRASSEEKDRLKKVVIESAPAQGRLVWHKVPSVPGPHLLSYISWFWANYFWRWWARRFRGERYDLVYSPGINCWDADAIAVHIVFHEFYRLVAEELKLHEIPFRGWPRALHRRLYYRLIMALEKRIYPNPRVRLAAVSGLAAREIERFFGRGDVRVISNAINASEFSPENRERHRAQARAQLRLKEHDFVLLLIGNDWKKKGLRCLLESLTRVDAGNLRSLVVGSDLVSPYEPFLKDHGLKGRVDFLPPRGDVLFYYSAADAYVGPSLEDAFALPPAEAMACGLPVIVSRQAGVSEWISHGEDGLILENPHDAEELARLICALVSTPRFCKRLGANAARTAHQYTWDRNVSASKTFLEDAIRRKTCAPCTDAGVVNGS